MVLEAAEVVVTAVVIVLAEAVLEALALAATEPGAAATRYEQFKRDYLQTEDECRRQQIVFVPLVAETTRGWGESGMKTIGKLAHAYARSSGHPASLTKRWILEGLKNQRNVFFQKTRLEHGCHRRLEKPKQV